MALAVQCPAKTLRSAVATAAEETTHPFEKPQQSLEYTILRRMQMFIIYDKA